MVITNTSVSRTCQFLRRNRCTDYQKGVDVLTHTSLDGSLKGAWSVPDHLHNEFLEQFSEDQEIVKAAMYVCELPTRIRRAYMDLDFSVEFDGEGNVKVPLPPSTTKAPPSTHLTSSSSSSSFSFSILNSQKKNNPSGYQTPPTSSSRIFTGMTTPPSKSFSTPPIAQPPPMSEAELVNPFLTTSSNIKKVEVIPFNPIKHGNVYNYEPFLVEQPQKCIVDHQWILTMIRCWQDVLKKFYPPDTDPRTFDVIICTTKVTTSWKSFKNPSKGYKEKYGVHVYAPNLYWESEEDMICRKALAVRTAYLAELEKRYPEEFSKWDYNEVVDQLVYVSTGLRMVGSRKCDRCDVCSTSSASKARSTDGGSIAHGANTTTRRDICTMCKGCGYVDCGRMYSLTDYLDGETGRANEKQKFLLSNRSRLLAATTIRYFGEEDTPNFRPFLGCPAFVEPPQSVFRSKNRESMLAKMDTQSKKVSKLGNNRMIFLSRDNPVLFAIQKFIRSYHVMYEDIIVSEVCHNEKKTFYRVAVRGHGEKYCLNKQDDHTSSHIFFYIDKNGLCQQCRCQKNIKRAGNVVCSQFKSNKMELDELLFQALFPQTMSSAMNMERFVDDNRTDIRKVTEMLEHDVYPAEVRNAAVKPFFKMKAIKYTSLQQKQKEEQEERERDQQEGRERDQQEGRERDQDSTAITTTIPSSSPYQSTFNNDSMVFTTPVKPEEEEHERKEKEQEKEPITDLITINAKRTFTEMEGQEVGNSCDGFQPIGVEEGFGVEVEVGVVAPLVELCKRLKESKNVIHSVYTSKPPKKQKVYHPLVPSRSNLVSRIQKLTATPSSSQCNVSSYSSSLISSSAFGPSDVYGSPSDVYSQKVDVQDSFADASNLTIYDKNLLNLPINEDGEMVVSVPVPKEVTSVSNTDIIQCMYNLNKQFGGGLITF